MFENLLLIYGLSATVYVLYKILIYKTDIYFFDNKDSFLFFFALITSGIAIFFSLKHFNAPLSIQRLFFSLIFLLLSIFISLKRFFYLKKESDFITTVHKIVWAIVTFALIILTLFSKYFYSANDGW